MPSIDRVRRGLEEVQELVALSRDVYASRLLIQNVEFQVLGHDAGFYVVPVYDEDDERRPSEDTIKHICESDLIQVSIQLLSHNWVHVEELGDSARQTRYRWEVSCGEVQQAGGGRTIQMDEAVFRTYRDFDDVVDVGPEPRQCLQFSSSMIPSYMHSFLHDFFSEPDRVGWRLLKALERMWCGRDEN